MASVTIEDVRAWAVDRGLRAGVPGEGLDAGVIQRYLLEYPDRTIA